MLVAQEGTGLGQDGGDGDGGVEWSAFHGHVSLSAVAMTGAWVDRLWTGRHGGSRRHDRTVSDAAWIVNAADGVGERFASPLCECFVKPSPEAGRREARDGRRRRSSGPERSGRDAVRGRGNGRAADGFEQEQTPRSIDHRRWKFHKLGLESTQILTMRDHLHRVSVMFL